MPYKTDPWKRVEEQAQDIKTRLENYFDSEVRVDVDKMAESLGVKIIRSKDLPDRVDAQLYVSSDESQKQITVNANRHEFKVRFHIVHELAYYMLNSHPADSGEIRHEKHDSDYDRDASEMAGKILIPDYLLAKAIVLYPEVTAESLEIVFMVPPHIMINRMRPYMAPPRYAV